MINGDGSHDLDHFQNEFPLRVHFRVAVIILARPLHLGQDAVHHFTLLLGLEEPHQFFVDEHTAQPVGDYAPGNGIKEQQQEMEEYLGWGAKAVKMKVGVLSLEEDAASVPGAAARFAF